jgi:hypothetical protein
MVPLQETGLMQQEVPSKANLQGPSTKPPFEVQESDDGWQIPTAAEVVPRQALGLVSAFDNVEVWLAMSVRNLSSLLEALEVKLAKEPNGANDPISVHL